MPMRDTSRSMIAGRLERVGRWPETLRSLLWMVPLAAGIAAVLVFGLNARAPLKSAGAPDAAMIAAAVPAARLAESVPSAGANEPPAAAQAPPAAPPAAAPAPVVASEVPVEQAPPLAAQEPAAAAVADAAPPSPASDAPAPALSTAEIEAHLARGEDKIRAGELAAARLFFERVALSGDPRGAIGMARTYDADVLAALPVIGPRADAAAARTWYERARSLQARL